MAFTFDFYVPRDVGNTILGSVFLEVVGHDGRTLAQIALEPRNPEGRPPNYYVFVEQRFAVRCALHFEYKARPLGNIVKHYVLRLKNHLPQNRGRANEALKQEQSSRWRRRDRQHARRVRSPDYSS